MKQAMARTVVLALLALVLGIGLVACGDDDGDAAATNGTATTDTAPGEGRPPVTLGTKNFPEQFVLGQLYAQALEARGFTVEVRENIGSTEIADRAIRSGQIDLYPEYIGIFNTAVAGDTRTYASADAAYEAAQRHARESGLALLAPTPFQNVDGLAVRPDYAEQHDLRSVGDLRGVPGFRLGGAPEFRNRATGLPGLERAYGITDVRFSPLTIGLQYRALDSGRIDVAQVFTTDGQLEGGRYVVLDDPKNVFGFQHVAPVVRREALTEQGEAFAETLDAVSRLLTTEAMQRMNAAVTADKQAPADVAREFLEANGLV